MDWVSDHIHSDALVVLYMPLIAQTSLVGFLPLSLSDFPGENNLRGTIPTELGLLTALTELDLRFNPIFGSIPSEIGKITSLTALILCMSIIASAKSNSL